MSYPSGIVQEKEDLLLLSHIFLNITLIDSCSLFGSSRLKSRELFFIAAGTDKCLFLTFHIHFHTFMTLGTTGIGSSGQGFFITALSVLTYKHFCILSIHCQKLLSAVRADFVCKIIMPEGSLSGFDLAQNMLKK